jgi:chromate transport protein ChrA
MRTAFGVIAATLTAGWGIAHLFPTRNVVRGFGEIGTENRRVITMEWIFEGVTLIFAGLLTAAVLLLGDSTSTTTTVVCVAIAALLLAMAVISLLTAGRNTFIAYRLCAPIFTASAILLAAAACS